MKIFKSVIFLFLVAAMMMFASACNEEESFQPNNNPANNNSAEHVERQGAVEKKGVCVSRYGDRTAESAERLNDLNISWYYNWGIVDPDEKIDAEFVPMIWGAGNVNEKSLKTIKDGYEAGKYKYLLTFNEPDAAGAGVSSNVSVDQAIALWPQLEEIGIPLSSPAPTDYSTGWLDEFMTKAKRLGYRVDFIALHCYQDFSANGAHNLLKKTLTEIYEKYQLPIWITEFATIDISVWGGGKGNSACTLKAAKTYIKNVTDMLESLGCIERYSWFIDNFSRNDYANNDNPHPEAAYTALYNHDDTISETGNIYKNRTSAIALQIDTVAIPDGEKGEEFHLKITASGGTGKYRFSSTPPANVTARAILPRGMSLSASGELYGTPQADGEYTICITVTDEGGQTAFRLYTFNVY